MEMLQVILASILSGAGFGIMAFMAKSQKGEAFEFPKWAKTAFIGGVVGVVMHFTGQNITAENYQVRDVADHVQRLIPEAKIVYTGEVGADPRNYRVKFDLLNSVLPDFRLESTLARGMEELHSKLVEHGFSATDFEGDQFVRLRTLQKRLDRLSDSV